MNIEDRQQWIRIEPYLDQALDLAPEALHPWLDALDLAQPEMAREIRKLLAERDKLQAAGFLETPPIETKLIWLLLGLLLTNSNRPRDRPAVETMPDSVANADSGDD